MSVKRNKFTVPYLTVIGTALIALFCFVILKTDLNLFLRDKYPGSFIDFSKDWSDGSGVIEDMSVYGASTYGMETEVSKVLPDELDDQMALCMISVNAKLDVSVDGTGVYHFDSAENLSGRGCGVTYHTVALHKDYAGKTISVKLAPVFTDPTGGRIGTLLLCTPGTFGHYVVRKTLLPAIFSVLIVFFGILMLIIQFLIPKKHPIPYHLASLGTALILIGIWCLIDSELPQYLTGCYYACRALDYTILHLACFPLLLFIISLTQKKRPVYIHLSFWWPVACLCALLTGRFLFGIDMHLMSYIVYIAYFGVLLLALVILIDNESYCQKTRTPSNLFHFYLGSGFLMAAAVLDIANNLRNPAKRMDGGYGQFLRIGLVIFLFGMVWQVLRWWTNDRVSIERDRVINRILQYAMSAQNADIKLNAVLEFMCRELHADRAYIFEDQLDGTFANTYEWCRAGVHPEIGNLQEVPYEGVIEVWYDEYKKNNHIIIEDLEKYRSVSEKMYQVLKPQGINTLVTGPLVVDGKYVGFYGVDNPPVALLDEVSEVLGLLSYVFAQMVSQRDEQNILLANTYSDEMTGVQNRRSLDEFEQENWDPHKPFGYIMCDINGLKRTNDTLGHDEGDEMIVDVANALATVFGVKNVYRMGGDEFVVYDFADSESVFLEEVDQLRDYIRKKSRSVSIGCVYCREGTSNIKDVKQKAETKMYLETQDYYNGQNDRRRNPRV